MDQHQNSQFTAEHILLQCCNNGQIVHFIGIGGIGMSGIAEILYRKNYLVTGSDIEESSNIHRLRNAGISINIKHDKSNISPQVACIVYTTGIGPNNPEIQHAKMKNIPLLHRGQVLAYLMKSSKNGGAIGVSGAHGKTSTTGIIGNLLCKAGLDPLIINGGVMTEFRSNIRLPETPISSKWVVAEADESDGTFNILPCSIAVITNIDMDHESYFETEENLLVEYDKFIRTCLSKGGKCIICNDSIRVQKLLKIFENTENIFTYGLSDSSFVQGGNISTTEFGTVFDVNIFNSSPMFKVKLPQYGEHSVQNALAAITVAKILDISNDIIRLTLKNNYGVKRRFTFVGKVHGISIYDDYAHHPAEIKAVLNGSRKFMENSSAGQGKLIIVHQPFRFSRLAYHFNDYVECFDSADIVLLLPVIAGDNESNINFDVSSTTLYQRLVQKSGNNVNGAQLCSTFNEVKEYVKKFASSGDVILFTGARSISQLAQAMPKYLE